MQEVGLPVEVDVRAVTSARYNAAASTMVVTLGPVVPGRFRERVFVREVGEALYREVLLPPDRWIVRDELIVSQGSNRAFVRLYDRADRQYGSICAIDLPGGEVTVLPEVHDPPATGERPFHSTLLGASPDGHFLYVKWQYYVPAGPPGRRIEHRVSRMSVATGELERIAVLPTPFA